MTREEAIRILGQYDVSAIQFYETDGGEIPWDKGYEALEMAISALKQPEIIHCQDCKYAKENQGELWICAHPDNNAWRITKEFYCGRAERSEE